MSRRPSQPAEFPKDANGDVLRRMVESGDDLSLPRDVEFNVVFENDERALEFAHHLLLEGAKVSLARDGDEDDSPLVVVAHAFMRPNHEDITAFEEQLGADATDFSGTLDGWGCIQMPIPEDDE